MLVKTIFCSLMLLTSSSTLEPKSTGLNTRSFTVNPTDDSSTVLFTDDSQSNYSIGSTKSEFFIKSTAADGSTISSIQADKNITITASNLFVTSLETSHLTANSVPQWQFYQNDNITENYVSAWTDSNVYLCNSFYTLGAECQNIGKPISRRFTDLTEHKYLSIVASFQFIGKWNGQVGYAKLGDEYVWTEVCYGGEKAKSCGKSSCKLNATVAFTVEHSDNWFDISFGSTGNAEEACMDKFTRSFAINDVQIFLK